MSDQKPPYALLIAGLLFLSMAVVFTYTGKAWGRSDGWVYRADSPMQYWSVIAILYLGGVAMVGVFFCFL